MCYFLSNKLIMQKQDIYNRIQNICMELKYGFLTRNRMNITIVLDVQKFDLQMSDISCSKWQEVRAEGLVIDNISLVNTKINNVNMSKMTFNDVNMGESKISNANLSGVEIQHANFSNAVIDHVYLFGTEFHNVVFPVEGDGNFNPDVEYKQISFQKCDLTKTQLKNCNLSNMEITDCNISGLKINGILIEELIKNK